MRSAFVYKPGCLKYFSLFHRIIYVKPFETTTVFMVRCRIIEKLSYEKYHP